MALIDLQLKGMDEFRRAISRNPEFVAREGRSLLVRSMAIYKKTVRNKPWKVGESGGGVPVDTGNLRDQHQQRFTGPLSIAYGPASNVQYAPFIHEGTGRLKPRPWLDHAVKSNEKDQGRLSREFLDKIVHNLAK